MMNSEEFTDRIKKILDYYDISASSFANKIEVGRSSISHILSGRNKPSLDFIMKILEAYPEIDLYWLMNGKGDFLKKGSSPKPKNKVSENISKNQDLTKKPIKRADNSFRYSRKIEKVIIFYNDGSFESFENNIAE